MINTINILPGEIHLWFVDDAQCHQQTLLQQYHLMLSEQERIQQQRFYFEKHRHQYLVTRALLRTVLSLYVPTISAKQWQFCKNQYGKPFIDNALNMASLQFNLSHTEQFAVLAITTNQAVGVDIEYLLRLSNTLNIAERFFSPTEVAELFKLAPEQQQSRFFDLWTLKEAYIKACGMGLTIPLDHFSYVFSPQGHISINFTPERSDQAELWRFWQICPNKTHKVSVAIKDENINRSYSLTMWNIIPLADIEVVKYPITMQSA